MIIQNVLKHGHSSESWRVLVINEHTAQILSSLFSNSELLAYEILTVQRLEDSNRESFAENPVIYFVDFNKDIYDHIKKDHASRKFSKYAVFSVCEIPQKYIEKFDKFSEPSVSATNIDLNFKNIDENAFICDSQSLGHVIKTLNIKFSFFTLGTQENKSFFEVENCLRNINAPKQGDCIFYSRFCDISTPLIRFFTFQVYLHELHFVRNDIILEENIDVSNSKLWNRIRDLHIAEVNGVLSEEASKLNAQLNLIKNADTKGLVDLVLKAPEQMALKQEVTVFLGLLDRTYAHFEKHKLLEYGCLQQNICMHKKEDGSRYNSAASDCWDAFGKSEYILEDKFRLWLLAIAHGCDFSSNENKQLIKSGIINKKDIDLADSIVKLRKVNILTRAPIYKYSMSRFQPLLYHVARDFYSQKKGLKFVKHYVPEIQSITSLRKSEFIFKPDSKHRFRKNMLIYIEGGITISELSVARLVSKELGIEIFIGSDLILDTNSFVQVIRNKNK